MVLNRWLGLMEIEFGYSRLASDRCRAFVGAMSVFWKVYQANNDDDEGKQCRQCSHRTKRPIGQHLVLPPSWSAISKVCSRIIGVL